MGLVDNYQVTLIFTAYVIFDLSWILLYPDVLPRYPGVIMVHHIITLALLSHPLRFPQDAHFTCLARPHVPDSPPLGRVAGFAVRGGAHIAQRSEPKKNAPQDGMVELSTFCLIARRQCKVLSAAPARPAQYSFLGFLKHHSATPCAALQGWLSKLLNYGYWTGTITLRLGLQPYLLARTLSAPRTLSPPPCLWGRGQRSRRTVWCTLIVASPAPLQLSFWRVTRKYDPVDRFIIMASQGFLCIFNVGLVVLALNSRREHKRKIAREKAAREKAQ